MPISVANVVPGAAEFSVGERNSLIHIRKNLDGMDSPKGLLDSLVCLIDFELVK
jgi:hypothetical protein